MAEMRESLKIVEQAIENLPAGPVNVDIDERDGAARQAAGLLRRIEGTIPHFELMMPNRGFEVPHEESLRGHRSAQRRAGLLHRRRRQRRAYRARCRPPSYIHFALFPHLISGHTLSDVVAVLGSLNIIAAELDRS